VVTASAVAAAGARIYGFERRQRSLIASGRSPHFMAKVGVVVATAITSTTADTHIEIPPAVG